MAVWVTLCGADGIRYAFELDEFTTREQRWVMEALRESLAHNDAA